MPRTTNFYIPESLAAVTKYRRIVDPDIPLSSAVMSDTEECAVSTEERHALISFESSQSSIYNQDIDANARKTNTS